LFQTVFGLEVQIMPNLPQLPPLAVAGLLVLLGLLLALVIFSRKRNVALQRSSGTEQLTLELRRMADALDRLVSLAMTSRQEPASRPEKSEPRSTEHHVIGSMFGR
jgi:hypothetical protein